MADREDREGLDWSSLHARVLRATAATHALLNPDEAAERRILDDRARRLAKPLESSDVSLFELCFFSIGRDEFAIESRFVRRIGPSTAFEPIPWAPPLLLGVINHHGAPLPLVDLRTLLGGARDDAELPVLLVLGGERDDLALAISTAEDIVPVRFDAVEGHELPESLRGFSFIRGLHLGQRLVLDGAALLEDSRLLFGDD